MNVIRKLLGYARNAFPRPQYNDHRAAVGGYWDELGQLQFRFLIARGLKPDHCFLEIGCGSLRAGQYFISYLDPGKYLGVDVNEELVRAGIARELDPNVLSEKRPTFEFNGQFHFEFSIKPDFAIAQSVFTHLTEDQIRSCLRNLVAFAPRCQLYASFGELPFRVPKLFGPDPQRSYYYTVAEMEAMAKATGWTPRYIGEWGHPLGLKMMQFTVGTTGNVLSKEQA